MLALMHQIEAGENIRGALAETGRDYELAIEAEALAMQQKRVAIQNYEDAESEMVSIAFADGGIDGKTAEIRKAQLDYILVRERNSGRLQLLWSMKLDAENAAVNTAIAREQMAVRYGATKHAGDLTAALLLATIEHVR